MKYDRNEMLQIFLANDELKKNCSLSDEELLQVNFSEDTGDLVIESLKALLMAFCKGESDTITIRQANLRIDSLSK